MFTDLVLRTLSFSLSCNGSRFYEEFSAFNTRVRAETYGGKGQLTLVRKCSPGPDGPEQYTSYDQYAGNFHVVSPTLEISIDDDHVVIGVLVFHEGNIDQEPVSRHVLSAFAIDVQDSSPSFQLRYHFGKGLSAVFFGTEDNSDLEVLHFKFAGLFLNEVLLLPRNIIGALMLDDEKLS